MSAKEWLIRFLPLHSSIPPFDPEACLAWGEKLADQVIASTARREPQPLDQLAITSRSSEMLPIFLEKSRGDLCLEMHSLIIGDISEVIVVNGELLSEWDTVFGGLPAHGAVRIISGYGAGECLYVPPESEIQRGGYEVERFKAAFGLSGDFYSHIDDTILAGLWQVLGEEKAE